MRPARTLWLIAAIGLAPIVASVVAYYWLTPSRRVNYGELLAIAPAPPVAGIDSEGRPATLADWRGKWVLLIVSPAGCAEACMRALYTTRQARTIQGAQQDRVARVLLQAVSAPLPDAGLSAAHPGLRLLRADRDQLAELPLAPRADVGILLLDTRGNLVLRYGTDPDIRGLAKDLKRLLQTSQIG
ncbi:MAG TPA: hypothetical protein VJQ49_13065 [Casimicrobiaceae bacterium]|nr:hypothetical protein [Casimicrobiaceae bacterium]